MLRLLLVKHLVLGDHSSSIYYILLWQLLLLLLHLHSELLIVELLLLIHCVKLIELWLVKLLVHLLV